MAIEQVKLPVPPAPDQEQPVAHPDQEYFDWIKESLAKLKGEGKTQRGLARALGVDAAGITRMLKGRRRIQQDEISKAAEYLGVPPPSVRSGHSAATLEPDVEPSRPVAYATVRGETAGGRWLEYEVGDELYQVVPLVPTRFPALEQFAYRVRGTSMDRQKILDGDYVVCVPYFEARRSLTDGDIVVVERRRAGLYERTCKLLRVSKDGSSLVPSSTDPTHEGPLFFSGSPVEDDGTEIEIVGLVVGRYAPISGGI